MYRYIGRSKAVACVWHETFLLYQENLNQKSKVQMSKLGGGLSRLVELKSIMERAPEANLVCPKPLVDFL